MDNGETLELTEPTESSALLGILPMFLRRKLVDGRSFREKIGFPAEEFVTFGEYIAFPRSLFFEKVDEALNGDGDQSEIKDKAGNRWFLSRKQFDSGRIVLKIANEKERLFADELFVFLADSSKRLMELEISLKDHGIPPSGLREWRDLLKERALTIDEFEEFSEDIMKTPFTFLKLFRQKIQGSKVRAEDMVPIDIEYYENLIGKGEQNNLSEFVSETISNLVADYLAWDSEDGSQMALAMCSHSSISSVIAESNIKENQLIELCEWVRDYGDLFSKVGIVEVALSATHISQELGKVLDDIVQQIISLDPEDKSGPLQLMMSLIVLVESEVSRTRVLRHWPPFRRRLATFTHAALLAREARGGIDIEHLSAWIMENQTHRFYLQNLIDLRAEPRWLPDYLSPSQLKQELLGRLAIAIGGMSGDLPPGPLHNTLDPQNTETVFNRMRTIKSLIPGPLEGADSSLRSPIPKELENELDSSLSAGALTAKSVTVLINTTGLFLVRNEKAERVVDLIRASNFRFAENMDEAERFSLIHGLAGVASRLRSESLARSVLAMARSCRDGSQHGDQYRGEVIISLVAAGAFEDFDSWRVFLGGWLKELCFSVNKSDATELEASVEMICCVEPRLRSELGSGLAALSSIY